MIATPTLHLAPIQAELILIGTGCAIVLIDLVIAPARRHMLGWLGIVGVFIAGVAVWWQWGTKDYAFADTQGMWPMILSDPYALMFRAIFLIATALTILMSMFYIDREGLNFGEYYALVLFCSAGMMLMACAIDLIVIFLALELFSISLYVLSSFARTRAQSQESGLKYLLIGGFASAFLLYGMALIYGACGTTNLYGIAQSLGGTGGSQSIVALVGTGLVVVGFGFKVALVPFHMWTPDVYEGAPTSITAYMSVGAKAAGFAAMLRVLVTALGPLSPEWSGLLSWLAIVTMIVGNVVAVAQSNIKRLLAYSAISHAGYITIGIIARNDTGLGGVLFYLLGYTFTNLGAFAVIIALGRKGEPNLLIRDYAGLARTRPGYAAALTLFLLSLAGIPLTAGFMGKLYIFLGAIQADLYALAIVGVLASVVGAWYYLRVVWMMYMVEPAPEEMGRTRSAPLLIAIGVAIAGVLVLGIMPGRFIEAARLAIEYLPL
jgi:NADH-quinone oxidoreductase subunit N